MKGIFLLLSVLSVGLVGTAYAHTTVEVPPYAIEAGWGIEPPIVGIRNNFVFSVTEPGEVEGVSAPIRNAFKGLQATAKFGGITKDLDIITDPTPGHYYSPVIPTKTGSMSIMFKGNVEGVLVDIEIPVEDVETTAVLDFPPRSGQVDQNVAPLKTALTALQQDVMSIKSGGVQADAGPAYDLAVFAMSLGTASIALAVIAMIKRK